jgi:hypothetical protein
VRRISPYSSGLPVLVVPYALQGSLDFICQLPMRDAVQAHIEKIVTLATAS